MDGSVWFSRRALKLHAVILIVVPGFMALCAWQIERAVGGNTLSWAYVFEWPLFAAYAVYMWWRFLHEEPDASPVAPTENGHAPVVAMPDPPTGSATEEDAELAAYNDYLARLAERDRAGGP
jgi:DNA-binding transcriptional regulator of glucitol operon